jgi:hypothetical protein
MPCESELNIGITPRSWSTVTAGGDRHGDIGQGHANADTNSERDADGHAAQFTSSNTDCDGRREAGNRPVRAKPLGREGTRPEDWV